jgi:hypothetical protein
MLIKGKKKERFYLIKNPGKYCKSTFAFPSYEQNLIWLYLNYKCNLASSFPEIT